MAEPSRYSAFPAAFTIAFAIAYAIAVDRNLALFTYHPALGEWGLGVQAPVDGPAMYWYGWLATAGLTAVVTGLAACLVPHRAPRFLNHWVWVVPVGALLFFAWLLRGFFFR